MTSPHPPHERTPPARRPHCVPGMTDLLTCDFIADEPDERAPRPAARDATGWEMVIFELMDDDDG